MSLDKHVKTALELEARAVRVPADEIRERIRRSGVTLKKAGWWERMRLWKGIEIAVACAVIAGFLVIAAGRNPTLPVAPAGGGGKPELNAPPPERPMPPLSIDNVQAIIVNLGGLDGPRREITTTQHSDAVRQVIEAFNGLNGASTITSTAPAIYVQVIVAKGTTGPSLQYLGDETVRITTPNAEPFTVKSVELVRAMEDLKRLAETPLPGESLKPPAHDMLTDEGAAIMAQQRDPRAANGQTKWARPQLLPDVEVMVGGKKETHAFWVVEGHYPNGDKVVVKIDAYTKQVTSADEVKQ